MTPRLPVRSGDPVTSRVAAVDALNKRRTVRERVLEVLRRGGPMTHDQLIDRLRGVASPSAIRTRTSELVTEGLVEAVPDLEGRSALGRRAKLWRAVR